MDGVRAAITGRMGWSGGSVSGSWPAICAISPRPRSNKAQQERNSAVKLGIVEPPSPLQARLSISHRILVLRGGPVDDSGHHLLNGWNQHTVSFNQPLFQ